MVPKMLLLSPLLLLLLLLSRPESVLCADEEEGGGGEGLGGEVGDADDDASVRPMSQYNKTQQERMLQMLEMWRSQVKLAMPLQWPARVMIPSKQRNYFDGGG